MVRIGFEPGVGGVIAVLDRQQQPDVGDLGIAALGQAELTIEFGQALDRQVGGENAEETHPLLGRPVRRAELFGRGRLIGPAQCQRE